MKLRALALTLPMLAACASTPSPSDAGAATSRDLPAADAPLRDAVAADVPEDSAAAEAPCARPPAERPPGSVCVREVRGQVVDGDGAPRVDIPVTVCGPTCWLARSDAQGRFAVPVGDFVPLAIYSVLAHGRPEHATVYVPMPDVVGAGDIVTIASPIRVPRYAASGAPVAGDAGVGRVAEAAGVRVSIPADAVVELDLEDFKLGELGRRLRVAEVPLDRAPPFAAEGRAQAVWALAPFGLTSTRPIALRVPNTLRLAPRTPVEFFVMGWDLLPPRSNAGRAVDAARGAVSDDGTTIETNPAEGVPVLTWVGVRARSN